MKFTKFIERDIKIDLFPRHCLRVFTTPHGEQPLAQGLSENIFKGADKSLNPLVANIEGANSKNLGCQNLPLVGVADTNGMSPCPVLLLQISFNHSCNGQLIIFHPYHLQVALEKCLKPED